jgi:hypothetical protein
MASAVPYKATSMRALPLRYVFGRCQTKISIFRSLEGAEVLVATKNFYANHGKPYLRG